MSNAYTALVLTFKLATGSPDAALPNQTTDAVRSVAPTATLVVSPAANSNEAKYEVKVDKALNNTQVNSIYSAVASATGCAAQGTPQYGKPEKVRNANGSVSFSSGAPVATLDCTRK